MKFTKVLLLIVFFFSCDTKQKEKAIAFNLVDTVSIPVDNTTVKESNTFQHFVHNKKNYLALFNSPKEEIVIFDYDARKLHKKIKLEEEGPNGVGIVHSFYIKSMDSIFVLSSALYSLSIVDSTGILINQFNLIPGGLTDFGTPLNENEYSSKPLMQSTNPILFLSNDKVALTGIPNKNPAEEEYYTNTPLYIVLNLKDKSIQYSFNYPKEYEGNLWGLYHNIPFHTYNPKTEKSVISLPISDKLYETDFSQTKEISCPCSNLGASTIWTNPDLTDPISSIKHFMESSSYYRVIYDQDSDVYYRFCQYPTDVDYKNFHFESFSIFREKKTSVAIFDSNYKPLVQIELPKGVDPKFVFVNNKGLHIYKENQNDDILLFDIFKIQ